MSTTADQPGPSETAAAADARQEADVWWGGYSGIALVPILGACFLMTLVSFGIAYYLWDERHVSGSVARWLAYHFNVLLWLTLALVGGYRMASYEHRLTTRRLFCLRGWFLSAPLPVKLTDIKAVRVQQSVVQRWLRVGRVGVEAKDRDSAIVFTGVREPQRLAELIRRQIKYNVSEAGSLPTSRPN